MKHSGFKTPGWHHARGMPDQPTFAEPPPCVCQRLARATSGHEKGIHWGRGHEGACMELGCGCLRYTPDDEASRGLLGVDITDASLFFPEEVGPVEESEADRSHACFQFLKKPDAVVIGDRSFITVRDLGGREKLLGDPNYFDVNDPVLYYAVEEERGEITVAHASKRGAYRAVGRPIAKGHATCGGNMR